MKFAEGLKRRFLFNSYFNKKRIPGSWDSFYFKLSDISAPCSIFRGRQENSSETAAYHNG
jgi:hypothetical protein